MSDASENRLLKQLKMQISFLMRSCEAFDTGLLDEGVRMSVVLRILFHNTKRQTSLLRELNRLNIRLLSTSTGRDVESCKKLSFLEGLVLHSNGRLQPKLDRGPFRYELPFSDWWNEIVLVVEQGVFFSRKEIILQTADKDGGAHVDKKLTSEYERLTQNFAFLSYLDGDEEKSEAFSEYYLFYIRQIAYEVLHSNDVIETITK